MRVLNGAVVGPVLDVNVNSYSGRGLLGITLHPNFWTNGFVYLYYTKTTTGVDVGTNDSLLDNRVERYTWNGTVLVNPTLITSLPADPPGLHVGGIITFGPDGKLYVVIGYNDRNGKLQNNSTGAEPDDTGVVLRLNDDGTIPTDNPFYSQGGNLRKYFAYGVRNSFGMAFDPVSGKLWMTDNGDENYDEINLVLPGFNSGWGQLMGPQSRMPGGTANLYVVPGSQYADPEFSWLEPVAPTAIVFMNSLQLGAQYENNAFVSDYNSGRIYRFQLNNARDGFVFHSAGLADLVADDETEVSEVLFGFGLGLLTDLKIGPDGKLYLLRLDGGIVVIERRLQTSPAIGISPGSFFFNVVQTGVNPASQTLNISNIGTGTLSWTLTADVPWLFLSPTTGTNTTETDAVTVNVNIAGLGANTYNGNITISATGASNTPQIVPVTLTISPSNQAPSVNAGPDQTITLPASAMLNGTVADDGLPIPPGALTIAWSKVSGPGTVTFANAAAANTSATFSTAGTYVLRLNANDGSLSSSDDVTVSVNSVPFPSVSINNVNQTEGNSGTTPFNFTVTLASPSSEIVTVSYSTINETATAGSDYVAQAGTLTFNPRETTKNITILVNGDTALEPDETFFVNLTSATNATIANGQGVGTILNDDFALAVTAFHPTLSGFDIHFNQAIDVSVLNLYDTESHQFGPPDVTMIGTTGPVTGSLFVDATAQTITFVKTGSVRAPGAYTVTLRSATDAFKDLNGQLLDGDGDGTPGGNYVRSFVLDPANVVVVSVPDFAVGPGQAVNVPFNQVGFPVTLSDGNGVSSVDVTVVFDPALLSITSAQAGTALPASATIQLIDFSEPGKARVKLISPTPLGSGAIEVLRLTATVPSSATYKTMNLLTFENVSLNNGAIPAVADDAVHVVAYIGDTTGNGSYSSLDAQRVLRVAAGLDSGFAAYPLIDPVIIGDVTGNGSLSSLDATRILQKVAGLDRPEIAPIPQK